MAPRHASDRKRSPVGKAIPYYIENDDEKLPPQGRFNYGQKLFFWGIFYSVILLLLSESSCGKPDLVPWNLRFLRYTAMSSFT